MLEESPAFRRALKECDRWGVPVIITPKIGDKYHQFSAPSHNAALDDDFGVIFWEESEERDRHSAAALLHEMTHVVVWRELGFNPDDCKEDFHSIGLEYESNRRIRTDWGKWMHNFQINGDYLGQYQDWPQATTQQRHKLLWTSAKYLQRKGLMKDGKPTYRHKYDIIDGKGRRIMTPRIAARIEAETRKLTEGRREADLVPQV